jgi:hypothetical protein
MKGGKLPFSYWEKGKLSEKFAKCCTLIWRALLFLFSFFAEKRGEAKRRLETPQKTEKR